MKYVKTYKIFESKDDNSELIRELDFYDIDSYTINSDGVIDVKGNVDLGAFNLKKIPFKFGKVTGYFSCSHNYLTSLEGCPKEVGEDFSCSDNKLKDLIGGPQDVGGDYFCDYNNLETLEGCAGDIGGYLNCSNNKLTSLDCSSVINGSIHCTDNEFTEYPEFYGVCVGKIIW